MNEFSRHETLWCEADVRFFTRHDANHPRHRKYRPQANDGDLIPRHHDVVFADEMTCASATIFSPDWQESAEFPSSHGWGKLPSGSIHTVWNRHGHNWFNVTRIDITFIPEDSPFYYYGRIITSGLGGQTCKLRRQKTKHQACHLIPRRCEFTPLGHGITRAEWKQRHDPRQVGWDNRTTHHEGYLIRSGHGWQLADSYQEAQKLQVLERMGLTAA